jgi:hypothetical protein
MAPIANPEIQQFSQWGGVSTTGKGFALLPYLKKEYFERNLTCLFSRPLLKGIFNTVD